MAIAEVMWQTLPVRAMMWAAEDKIVLGGYDCTPQLLAMANGAWSPHPPPPHQPRHPHLPTSIFSLRRRFDSV